MWELDNISYNIVWRSLFDPGIVRIHLYKIMNHRKEPIYVYDCDMSVILIFLYNAYRLLQSGLFTVFYIEVKIRIFHLVHSFVIHLRLL